MSFAPCNRVATGNGEPLFPEINGCCVEMRFHDSTIAPVDYQSLLQKEQSNFL